MGLTSLTSTVHDFCTFAVLCSVTRAYEGHFIWCYKEGISSRVELLDRGMANSIGHRSP